MKFTDLGAPFVLTTLLIVLGTVCAVEDKKYWMDVGQRTLKEALNVKWNERVAKNVILFLGDGMGLSTVHAARIYKGQQEGQLGEDTQLSFEKFPHVALSKTYCADRQTCGSASTGTAYHSGVKVNHGTVGVDARVKRQNCTLMSDPSVKVKTMLDWSLESCKSVGIVTNTRVTHASPAGAYAHSPDRNWERDRDIANLPDKCVSDIATQLVKDNPDINVILGGGRRGFIGRDDGKNLVEEWKKGKDKARYVQNAAELRSVNVDDTDKLLGLFTESHMTWELERDKSLEPSLSEMTRKAIELLRRKDEGFYLFVEGGRIDHGHHDNWAKRALSETVELDNAVKTALDMTDSKDTLIVVTADHSHPFSAVGYPKRGNDILGLVNPVDSGQEPTDGKPYTTLIYGNGRGPQRELDFANANLSANNFSFPVAVPMSAEWETHSGEDVAIYALGPMAHLFHGVHEENYIAHAMAYAACVGPNLDHCGYKDGPPPCAADGVRRAEVGVVVGALVSAIVITATATYKQL